MGEGVPLQAILLADSISRLFEPITLPKVNSNTPMNMIDHTLAWLESAGVEQVFVLCCASSRSKPIMDYLDKKSSKPNLSVTPINCITAVRDMIHSDFILVSGDVVTNMMLTQALEEHKEKNAVMTMVIKPCQVGSADELIMAIDPTTKELLHYEDKSTDDLNFNKSYLTVNPCFTLHNDKQDCYIDICSPQVLGRFTDNFDYQHPRRHLFKGDGLKIFTHEIHSSYYAELLINKNPTEPVYNPEAEYQFFEGKVEEIFLWGVDKNAKTGRALQRLQLTCGMGREEYASALLYSIIKFALDNSKNSGNDLVMETSDVVSKWGKVLKPHSRGVDAQIQVLLRFEKMCLESAKEYAPLFVQVLHLLYGKDIIQEEALLNWAAHKKANKLFVEQSEGFIQKVSEDKYCKFQENALNEGCVQVKKLRRRPKCKLLKSID